MQKDDDYYYIKDIRGRVITIVYNDDAKTSVKGKLMEGNATYLMLDVERDKKRFVPWSEIHHVILD